MKNKVPPEKSETKLPKIMIPEEFLKGVKSYCNEKNVTVKEFLTDAIIDTSM